MNLFRLRITPMWKMQANKQNERRNFPHVRRHRKLDADCLLRSVTWGLSVVGHLLHAPGHDTMHAETWTACFLIYSLENRSFIHLEFTHPYTRDYFKIIKQEFSRVSSHGRNGAKKNITRVITMPKQVTDRVLSIWFILNYWENYSLPPDNNPINCDRMEYSWYFKLFSNCTPGSCHFERIFKCSCTEQCDRQFHAYYWKSENVNTPPT